MFTLGEIERSCLKSPKSYLMVMLSEVETCTNQAIHSSTTLRMTIEEDFFDTLI